jgi:hypothetical protein
MTETELIGHLPEGYKQAIPKETLLKRNTKYSDVSNAVFFVSNPSRALLLELISLVALAT